MSVYEFQEQQIADLRVQCDAFAAIIDGLEADCDDLRARLAEVEAERQGWESDFRDMNAAHTAAEARLAEVLALCDQTGGGPDAWLYVIDVLAAACGEGDRPPPECPHPDWSFDRTICGGCDSMPDVCTECGWHECGEDDRRNLES